MALFRHVALGVAPGETWSFTMHTEGEGSLASAQTAWEAATGALWTDELDDIVASVVQMTEVSTASLDEETGAQMSRLADDVSRPGVSEDEMLPFQCSVAVSLRSDLATRSGRGRFYLPPLDVSVMDEGRLSSAAVTAVVDAATAFFASLDGNGLQPVLLNRSSMVTTDVSRFDVGDVIDTQRRRRNKLQEVRSGGDL